MEQDISPALSFRECSLGLLIDCELKSLDFEGHTWNRGKCGDIQTYKPGADYSAPVQTYLHRKISNEAGFGHRPYSTWMQQKMCGLKYIQIRLDEA